MIASQPKQRQRQRKTQLPTESDQFDDSVFDEWREVAPGELFPPDDTAPINPLNEHLTRQT